MFSNFLKGSKLNRVLGVVSLIILLTVSYILYVVWLSMPVLRGSISHPDIQSRVEVTRDAQGVPRIIGDSTHDVLFAQGYTHAQDRMFQMVFMKHMFLGRLSEIVGSKTIGLDRYMRYFNVEESANASYAQFGKSYQKALEAYSQGVNAYIAENRKTIEEQLLGFQMEPWRPQDSVVIQKAIAFDLSRHWPRILRNTAIANQHGLSKLDELYPTVDVVEPSVQDSDLIRHGLPYDERPREYPDGPEISDEVMASLTTYAKLNDAVLNGMQSDETLAPGSNVWSVAPERNASKHAVVASDPHLSYHVPNTFYLIHLKSDKLDLTGASIPGAPGIIIGRNANISWGFTNSRLDQTDIFYAKNISGKRSRMETIKVKGGESLELQYIDSDYGTLISDEDSPLDVALLWTGMDKVDTTLDAIYLFSQARSLEDAKPHFRRFASPAQNLSVIDDQGNYGFYALGKIPVRSHSGRVAVPATKQYQWRKFIPSHHMPYAENPPRGYVMNANNTVVSPHYGYNLSKLGFDDLRAIRLAKLLKEDKLFTVSDHMAIQLDNEDQQWWIMRDTLLKAKASGPLAENALKALEQWDGDAARDRFEVTIFSAWQREIATRIYKNISTTVPKWAKPVHDDFFVINSIRNNTEACDKQCDVFLTDTLDKALENLTTRYGTEDITQWVWEGSHQALFRHGIFKKVPVFKSLSERTISVDGTRDSLNRSRWFAGNGGFMGTQGACLRMIVDLDSPQGNFSMPMGESGNIFSKHYDDLLPIWAEGDYLRLPKTQSEQQEAQLVFHSEK